MDWTKWDIALLGRAIGLLIIGVGIFLSAWDVWDRPDGLGASDTVRLFIQSVLNRVFPGVVIVLVAELAQLLPWRRSDTDSSPTWLTRFGAVTEGWTTPQIGLIAGLLIIVVGGFLSAWSAIDRQEEFEVFGKNAAARLFLSDTLRYLFNGALIIVLAEFVDRIGWRGEEEEEEVAAAPTR